VRICVKREKEARQCGYELTENKGLFDNTLVMIDLAKNYDFWCIDTSVC